MSNQMEICLFVCLFVLSLFGLYQKATLGRKWSFWVTVEHYIKERCCSLRQDISPVWKYLGTTVVFSCQYSFCEYLPGTYSAMHAPMMWGIHMLQRTAAPRSAGWYELAQKPWTQGQDGHHVDHTGHLCCMTSGQGQSHSAEWLWDDCAEEAVWHCTLIDGTEGHRCQEPGEGWLQNAPSNVYSSVSYLSIVTPLLLLRKAPFRCLTSTTLVQDLWASWPDNCKIVIVFQLHYLAPNYVS